MTDQSKTPFNKVIQALLDADTPLDPRYLYSLSDMDKDELAQLGQAWGDIPAWRRKALLEDVETLAISDDLLSFEALAQFALQDEDPAVRLPAVRVLWDFDEPELIDPLLRLAEHDPHEEVRAAAAQALGTFTYLGELEELPEDRQRLVEDTLLRLAQPQHPESVRMRALESLGFSSRDEVSTLIEIAYRSGDKAWMAAAAVAMGRSASDAWLAAVQDLLDSPHPTVRAQAAAAAGELEFHDAVPRLLDLLEDPDPQVVANTIWSLSQIGGEGVRDALEELAEQAEDDEEIELLDDALENLTFTEEVANLPMFDLMGSEIDDMIDDLLGPDDDEDEEDDEADEE